MVAQVVHGPVRKRMLRVDLYLFPTKRRNVAVPTKISIQVMRCEQIERERTVSIVLGYFGGNGDRVVLQASRSELLYLTR